MSGIKNNSNDRASNTLLLVIKFNLLPHPSLVNDNYMYMINNTKVTNNYFRKENYTQMHVFDKTDDRLFDYESNIETTN